ncbi:RIO1 family protein [Streptomyces sp. SolWspMP-5a-2]|nr:RIO1 family regulatory kinase/ATPase [Streptomyces sp. SID4950]SCD40688.1 RIO1 family protein [Streptomyces sp. SolWspMP-5a-2]
MGPVERREPLPQMRGHPAVTHIPWAGLPAHIHDAVTTRHGTITAVRDITAGFNCHAAAVLDTGSGALFVKATRGHSAGHDREAAVAPHTGPAAPALLWRTTSSCSSWDWDLIAFHAVDGLHADLTPGSPHLAAVADLLTAAELPAPSTPHLPSWSDQWAAHATPGELEQLHGTHLVHGDINPHNLLADSTRIWLVDWALAARGPAWADTAETAIRLIEDGHTAAGASAWASTVPAWRAADPAAVALWAELRCRALTAAVGPDGARRSNDRHQALATERAQGAPAA